jgi:hypothetical protein
MKGKKKLRIKSLKSPKKPKKAQTFEWEPIKGLNLEPKTVAAQLMYGSLYHKIFIKVVFYH